MLYHAHTVEEVFDEFKTSEKGLHQIYADERLMRHGQNHLRFTRRSAWAILANPFANAFSALFLIALGLSLLMGRVVEAVLILLSLLLTASISYTRSISSARTLKRLEREAVGRTHVRRDGIEARIDATQLVPGDIVLLRAGDLVPADGRVIHSAQLHVNQLQLTGQADPVAKHPRSIHSDTELAERSNMVYRGTYVTGGTAQFVVTATGNRTEYGLLLQQLSKLNRRSSLQQKINSLTDRIIVVVLVLVCVLLGASMYHGMPLEQSVQYLIVILIASVPALTQFAVPLVLISGLRTLWRHKSLVRSTEAIEYISMISSLAADKTGILARANYTLGESWHPGVGEAAFATLCRQAALGIDEGGDDVDKPLMRLDNTLSSPQKWHAYRVFSFDHDTQMSGKLWHHGSRYKLTIKGAPEKILRLASLTETEYEQAITKLHQLTASGCQVVALAQLSMAEPIANLTKLSRRSHLEFVGFIALRQRLRLDARTAITDARAAGISVRMMTGDHGETAYRIAQQLGIAATRSELFDGRKLDVMTDAALGRAVRDTTVFARITPSEKYRIISALKHHHVVAATGNTTADIPALRHAHVGISMHTSSLLARDASDLILLDDSFVTINHAIRWCRTILGNIRRMLLFILTLNTSELLLVACALLLGFAPVLSPVQLLWINLVAGALLTLPLGYEPHSRNIMRRRPVSPKAGILPRYLIARLALIAATMTGVTLAGYVIAQTHHSTAYAQAIAFNIFVLMQLVVALSARSDHTSTLVRFRTASPRIYCGIVGALLLHICLFTTPLGQIIGIVQIPVSQLLASGGLAILIVLIVSEASKWYSRHAIRSKGRSYE